MKYKNESGVGYMKVELAHSSVETEENQSALLSKYRNLLVTQQDFETRKISFP